MERKRRKNCCGWTFCFWKKFPLENRSGKFLCRMVPLISWFGNWNEEKEPVSFVFRENSPFKIRVGKQIRAIELVLTLKESTFLPDTSYRAVIDKKQKVYIPEGVIPPEEDGSNRTPAGLKVDKNGKI